MNEHKEEFLKILAAYQGILHKVNLVYFRNRSDREENFQEIIFQLWKSYPSLKDKNSLGSWIYSVSINTSISRLRKYSRLEYQEELPESPDTKDFIEEMVLSENQNRLLEAISKLNEVDKSIMLLYLDEKSYDQIAHIMGISKSLVGVRINRAKELLKKNLNPSEHGK